MLWIVTGGVGSGKTAFARRLAEALGREAIWLTCPAFPDDPAIVPARLGDSPKPDSSLRLATLDADADLARKLQEINLSSNPFRIDQRVVVFDGLAGWLRRRLAFGAEEAAMDPGHLAAQLDAALDEIVEAILAFAGRRIVVTEEPAAGLAGGLWERWYATRLSAANMRLASACDGMHRLTAGVAAELKGLRTKRGIFQK
ncbi:MULTISPECIES: bifunctional adenosylcobinamide kinase/adenosylcobinamide-phosphate guanylyltransferase [Cohnella]|uniref:bifunctional adenosylcobinamide kinase/adenosylcobinamide-phosphate guanylyltransferase n=1 Tax=Cohnella TaxID=329857 RepID=UPI0009BA374C|nr:MULTISPECIES: bifunctional adenosylcobinamide kinase/adenosylcobinamide-phosphate guanylyltransferase [Cohnella]MBN2979891.1 bifunctional adenosylcobinamide kinase/adenosylcobinamide-phosphate guanylyltransferase [Cohnella algarum]